MSRKVELSPSFLREKYHEEGKTLSEIAEEVGCSPATVHNRMEEHGIERRHPKAWKDRVTVTCANCGSEKDVEQAHFEAFDRFYCDNECQGKFLQKTGRTRGENNGRWKGKISVDCAYCGDEVEVYPCRLDEKENHLCSQSCRAAWYSENLSGEDHPLWQPGNNQYSGRWLAARRQVRNRDGNECQLCGRSGDDEGRVPDVHHIEPVRSFETEDDAHVPDNLIQLCRSCHAQMEQLKPERQRTIFERKECGPFDETAS